MRGYYHRYVTWRCVGTGRTDVSSEWGDDGNYYPWQKYNPSGRIPTEYKLHLANTNAGTIPTTNEVALRRAISKSGSVARLNIPLLFFASAPRFSFFRTQGNSTSPVFISSVNTVSVAIKLASASHNFESHWTLFRDGDDLLQTQLDNKLKG